MLKKSILLLCGILILASCVLAADADKSTGKRLLTINASDYIEALPDTAYFNFTYSVEKDTAEEASSLGNKIKKNVKDVLAKNQVAKEDIIVDASSLSERYDYDQKKTFQIYNYIARVRLTDFAKISLLRNELVNAQVFAPVQDSWFSRRGLVVNQYTDYEIVKQKTELEKQALKKAYEKALQKLKVFNEVSNFKYQIYRVTEAGSDYQPQAYYARKSVATMANMDAAAPGGTGEETLPTLQRINSSVIVEAEII